MLLMMFNTEPLKCSKKKSLCFAINETYAYAICILYIYIYLLLYDDDIILYTQRHNNFSLISLQVQKKKIKYMHIGTQDTFKQSIIIFYKCVWLTFNYITILLYIESKKLSIPLTNYNTHQYMHICTYTRAVIGKMRMRINFPHTFSKNTYIKIFPFCCSLSLSDGLVKLNILKMSHTHIRWLKKRTKKIIIKRCT